MKKITLSLLTVLSFVAGVTHSAVAQQVGYGLNSTLNTLTTFSVTTGASTSLGNTITGAFNVGETISAIDFRPLNQTLYGYSSANRLFSINTTTFAATLFSDLSALTAVTPTSGAAGSNIASTFPPTGVVSIDVNPTVTPAGGTPNSGALRILDTTGQNFRYVFDTNVLNRDDTVTAGANIVGAAYTNNDLDSATTTSLYVIDGTTNSLYLVNPPNDGVLLLVGTQGSLGSAFSSSNVGFDIPLFGTTNAYASAGGSFYSIDLTLGTATLIGDNTLTGINDIAVAPEPSTYALLALGGGLALFVIKRRNRLAIAA